MESPLLLFTCILSALVATGFSLSCSECSSEDVKSCKGTVVQCPSDSDVCVAINEISVYGNQERNLYRRFCGSRALCNLKESLTGADATVLIGSSCCFTNNCVPSLPMVPQTKSEKNGVICKECQGFDDKPCISSNARECTGDENQCVSLTTRSSMLLVNKDSTDSSLKSLSGCGTQRLCNLTEVNIKIGGEEEHIQFSCLQGSGNIPHSLFLLIFAPMFLVKIFG
ncbi:phospholipase A2 inhibitor gamma subunit B-like [Pyxicephalus adspersus]|uniref:UPAR/Ly6 domain-containing protein n=1 Tax=Pyxicephalus adspersus TaxID=30357 RepID=A0AAV2ZP78_PYXAD|nr:TPA: hypothetical protein GDO54_003247 [Pyxicephalus adspersus]